MSNTSNKKQKKGRRRKSNGLLDSLNALLTLVVMGILVGASLLLFGTQRYYAPGPMGEEQVFQVERGAGLAAISLKLESADLIADRWTFQLGAMAQRKQSAVRAGEYRIVANASMADILLEITEGRAITYSVTIPEGFTSWQIVQRLNEAANMVGEITEIPAEGSLLPDTYNFEKGSDRKATLEQMRAQLETRLAEIWAGRASDLPISSPEELIVLASIVEKETGIASERPEVAAVFINRLNLGMRLQSDPTIIYGITNGQGPLGRGLRRSEIEAQNPYNTYQIDGLPPGPIANPGVDALQAVANPSDTKALYFVADGSGGHAFANTYVQHQENVARWRVIERERADAAEEAQAAEEAAAARDAIEAEQAQAVDEAASSDNG